MKKEDTDQSADIPSDLSDENSENQVGGSEAPEEKKDNSTEPERENLSETDRLKLEILSLNDKFLRLYSEFENYKKRVSRDRIEMSKTAGTDIFVSLLPVLDDFERANKALNELPEAVAAREGINLIYSKLKNTLLQKGLLEMKSSGEVFDSDLHEAVTMAAAPGPEMKGKVLEELEKGYFLNGKVIRHAKVVVGS